MEVAERLTCQWCSGDMSNPNLRFILRYLKELCPWLPTST